MEAVKNTPNGPPSQIPFSRKKSTEIKHSSPAHLQHDYERRNKEIDEQGRSTPPTLSQAAGELDESDEGRVNMEEQTGEDQFIQTDDARFDQSTNPEDEIEAFDWQNLDARYHDAIDQCREKESMLLQDFGDLNQVSPSGL